MARHFYTLRAVRHYGVLWVRLYERDPLRGCW